VKRQTVEIDFNVGGVVMTAGNAPPELRAELAKVEDDFRRQLADIKIADRDPPIRIQAIKTSPTNYNFSIQAPKELVEQIQKRLGMG
jgi:hypothetical protein